MKHTILTATIIAVLLNAGSGSVAEEEIPWHVQDAEIRIPLAASFDEARHRMPPDVYLADLSPVETKGLSFDPTTKNAVTRDGNTPEQKAKIIEDRKKWCEKHGQKYDPDFYKTNWLASGSATFSLKPEYRWFSFWTQGHMKVSVDGRNIHDSNADPRRAMALPPEGKTLTIEGASRWINQAGFITRSPPVARATFCLSGSDPAGLIPIVHRLSGERVGCRILWAYPGEPMSILFDCSSGETQYMVYLVDRSRNPPRLPWVPRAGLIRESRYLNHYDPAVETIEGYEKLWNNPDFIAGKQAPEVIFTGALMIRPFEEDWPRYYELRRQEPLALTRYTGFFHVPATRKYHFFFMSLPGGYLMVDNQLVTELSYEEARAIRGSGQNAHQEFVVELEKGLRQLDFCQYGSGGNIYASLCWRQPIKGIPHNREEWRDDVVFGRGTAVWEPMAQAAAGMMTYRAKKPAASFTWRYAEREWMGKYPARDIIGYSFTGALSEPRDNAVFRWQFDDGHKAEGKEVLHMFFSPGQRQVHLDVLDGAGGKVIASVSGKVHVHVSWDSGSPHYSHHHGPRLEEGPLSLRADEFASGTPIEEVVSLCYWCRTDDSVEGLDAITSALAKRVDEVIDKYPYTLLSDLAEFLSAPTEAHYDAAEKLLRATMERAPAGGRHWTSAALTLAELLVTARGKPQGALALLEQVKKTKPVIDVTGGWRAAEAKQWHSLTASDDITGILNGLSWTNALLPLSVNVERGLGLWLAKDLDLPASWKGKELVFALGGGMQHRSGAVWFNGKRLGGLWQWPDGNFVVPAGMLRRGGKNRFAALFQSTAPPPGLFHNMSVPAFSADLERVASARPDHTVRLHDLGTRKELFKFRANSSEEGCPISFSRDGNRLASGNSDGTVTLWDTVTGKELFTLRGHGSKVVFTAFSPDGSRLASGTDHKAIKLWDMVTGKELFTLGERGVNAVAFSPDGRRLASATRDERNVKLWDTVTGKELFTLNDGARSLAFSPDGNRLASGTFSGSVKIWDSSTQKELLTLQPHDGDVVSLAFAPDGRHLAAGGGTTVKIWDTAAKKEVLKLKGHQGDVRSVAFSADGRRLASSDRDVAILWAGDSAGKLGLLRAYGSRMNPVKVDLPGPPKEEGYTFPLVFHTSEACDEQGVNYAYYEGTWETLPDFDKLEPVKKGTLKQVDLSPRNRDENFGMKFTGYLKVRSDGVYAFSVKSDNGSRLSIDSKTVIDNDGNDTYDTRGEVPLAEGVHAATLTYFNSHASFALNIALPNSSISAEEVTLRRIRADALMCMGEVEKAKAILMDLKPGAWPIDEKAHFRLTSDLKNVRLLAKGKRVDIEAAMSMVNSWLDRHPMLRTVPGYMNTKIELHVEMGDYARAFTLAAEQMRRTDMYDRERWDLMLVQVKAMIKAGNMDAARKLYQELKQIAPYSEATLAAQEAIKKAVLGAP